MQKIDRDQFLEEQQLRKYIRSAIKIVQERRSKKEEKNIFENEQRLRSILRKLILEVAVADETPHSNTGINALKPLLKAILQQIKGGYMKLTTNIAQRESYRSHLLNAIEKTLAPERVTDLAGEEIAEGIELALKDEDKFISTPHAEEEKLSPEEEEREEFTMEEHDLTGRNEAFKVFKSIENQIVSEYDDLEDDGDRKPFYDYLITNLKMYFDLFEDELTPKVVEPTTPEYEKEKTSTEVDPDASEFAPPDEEMPEGGEEEMIGV